VSLFVQVIPEWLDFVSLASTTGVLVCLLWVLPPDEASARGSVLDGMRQLLGIGVAVLFASNILGLLVRASEMGGQPISGVLAVLPTVVLRTHLGTVWIVRMAALAVLSATIIASRRARNSRLLPYLMLGCTIVVSATESASGHASDAGDFSAAEIMDWLHLLGPMIWGGGLLVLSLVILPCLVKEGDRAARSIAGVATRFSRIAGVAVAFIALTAVYQAWNYARSVEALGRSPYGRTIIAKIVLFSLLLCLGAFNRYIRVPRLQEWAGSAKTKRWVLGCAVASVLLPLARDARGPLVAKRFTRSVKLEACLVLAVLLCAAVLRHEIPARHAHHTEHDTSVMRPDR
jgi:putative copper resistance protein D